MRTRRCTPVSGLEKAVRVQSLDLEHRALDARLFALAQVEDLDGVALSLGPARVHAHEHLRPVLRFGAAGAGADLELRVAKVVGPRQQRPKLGTPRARRRSLRLRARPPPTSRRSGSAASISSSSQRALHAPTERVERLDPALQRLDLLDDRLRALSWSFQKPGAAIRSSSCVSASRLRSRSKIPPQLERADLGVLRSCRARSVSAIVCLSGNMTRAVLHGGGRLDCHCVAWKIAASG